jgi:hypothetical protein
MRFALSRSIPTWLHYIGWPERHRIRRYTKLFLLLLAVLLLLHTLGVDTITAIGWISVASWMTSEFYVRLRSLQVTG